MRATLSACRSASTSPMQTTHSMPKSAAASPLERLRPGVALTHVADALHAEERSRRGRGDAMLAGAGLGDEPGLANAPGDERLAEHVVDLVRAGVVEVFPLEDDAGAA